jgi:hypothetical protein
MSIRKILLVIIGAILSATGTYVGYIGWQERIDALNAVRGELISPYPVNILERFNISIGTIGTSYSYAELKNGIDLTRLVNIQVGNQTTSFPVKIDFIDNKLSVSAMIKNAKNETLTQIENNEWKSLSPDNMLIWDRNYNSYAFEVLDPNHIPALQVLMGQQNTVSLGFSLYAQGIPIFFTVTKGTYMYPSPEEIQEIKNATLFKYPSSKYPNELTNSTGYPSSDLLARSTWVMVTGGILGALGLTAIGVVGINDQKKRRRNKQARARNYLRDLGRQIQSFVNTIPTSRKELRA